MSRAYITLWSQPEVEIEHRGGPTENLRHTANAQFGRVGVEPGDRVYIVATRKGQLLARAADGGAAGRSGRGRTHSRPRRRLPGARSPDRRGHRTQPRPGGSRGGRAGHRARVGHAWASIRTATSSASTRCGRPGASPMTRRRCSMRFSDGIARGRRRPSREYQTRYQTRTNVAAGTGRACTIRLQASGSDRLRINS